MIKSAKAALLELLIFLKNPVDQPDPDQSIKKKIIKLFYILVLDICMVWLCGLLVMALSSWGLFSLNDHKLYELLESMPKSMVILLCVIIVPMIEELIFRLYLRYKTNYPLRFFLSLFYVTGRKNKEKIERRVKKVWFERYGYVFYFSALIFGFVHLFNFTVDYRMLLLFPIITSPQIIAGVFMGYLRVRYNLIWGYLLHGLHNLIAFSPFLLMGGTIEVLNKSTDEYTIRIEEVIKDDSDPKGKVYPDSLYFKKVKLKDILHYTTKMEPFLIQSNNDKEMNRELNLVYKNKTDSGFSNYDKVNEALIDLYKFQIIWDHQLMKVWRLDIVDSVKLLQHRTDSTSGNYLSFSADSATIRRTQLPLVALAIQKSKGRKVFMNDHIEGRFNIALKTSDTTELKQQMSSIYGLQLVDSVASVEYLKIDFENQ